MGKICVIGDVHGMLSEFEELITKLNPAVNDTIVYVGDLVDKGPESARVVKLARELSRRALVTKDVFVIGNHEQSHRRFWAHVVNKDGRESRMKNHLEMAAIQKDLSDDDRSWLFSAPRWVALPRNKGVVVHGGIPEGNNVSPLMAPDRHRYNNKSLDEALDKILRLRYVNPDTGKFVGLSERKPTDVFWTKRYTKEHYPEPLDRVFYGHEPFVKADRPVFENNTYGLDLGCVYGNKLCAYVIDEEGVEYSVTVQAKKAYAEYWDR